MSTTGMVDPLEQQRSRNDYDGQFFLGTVVDNEDPQKEERLRIRIPNLLGEELSDTELPWARPVKHRVRGSNSQVQSLSVPVVGSKMIVVLQNGDPYHPLYLGSLLVGADVASVLTTNYPKRYGLRDDKGNHMFVDTQTGDMELRHFSGTTLKIVPDGSVSVTSPKNLTVAFDGNASVAVKGNLSATVDGNASAVVKGTLDVKADGATTIESSSGITITAPTVDIN